MTPLGMQKIILTESIEVGQIGLFLDYSSNLGNGLMNFLPFYGRLRILPVAADLISLDMFLQTCHSVNFSPISKSKPSFCSEDRILYP